MGWSGLIIFLLLSIFHFTQINLVIGLTRSHIDLLSRSRFNNYATKLSETSFSFIFWISTCWADMGLITIPQSWLIPLSHLFIGVLNLVLKHHRLSIIHFTQIITDLRNKNPLLTWSLYMDLYLSKYLE